jgi:hypothetical protein
MLYVSLTSRLCCPSLWCTLYLVEADVCGMLCCSLSWCLGGSDLGSGCLPALLFSSCALLPFCGGCWSGGLWLTTFFCLVGCSSACLWLCLCLPLQSASRQSMNICCLCAFYWCLWWLLLFIDAMMWSLEGWPVVVLCILADSRHGVHGGCLRLVFIGGLLGTLFLYSLEATWRLPWRPFLPVTCLFTCPAGVSVENVLTAVILHSDDVLYGHAHSTEY